MDRIAQLRRDGKEEKQKRIHATRLAKGSAEHLQVSAAQADEL